MVDIAAGITLAGQALAMVKGLRDIERGFDVAVVKGQMAELYGALAEMKMAFADAREELHEKDKKIKELEDKIVDLTSGEQCPICRVGRLSIVRSERHPDFGDFGFQLRHLKCDKCPHTEERMHDPAGLAGSKKR